MRTPPSALVTNISPEKQALGGTAEGLVDCFRVGFRVGRRVGFRVGLRVGVRIDGRRVGWRDITRFGGRRVGWGVDDGAVAQHFSS